MVAIDAGLDAQDTGMVAIDMVLDAQALETDAISDTHVTGMATIDVRSDVSGIGSHNRRDIRRQKHWPETQ